MNKKHLKELRMMLELDKRVPKEIETEFLKDVYVLGYRHALESQKTIKKIVQDDIKKL